MRNLGDDIAVHSTPQGECSELSVEFAARFET